MENEILKKIEKEVEITKKCIRCNGEWTRRSINYLGVCITCHLKELNIYDGSNREFVDILHEFWGQNPTWDGNINSLPAFMKKKIYPFFVFKELDIDKTTLKSEIDD